MKKVYGVIFMVVCLAAGAWAQEAAVEAAERVSLFDLIKQGGITMIPLGALSVAMIYFIVQNFASLRTKAMLRNDLMPELLKKMKSKDVDGALKTCDENPALFTMVLGAGLERCQLNDNPDFLRVKESVEEATVEQMASLMKPIDYLSIIGAVAPMLGLLGTVSGMIKAFQTMGTQGMGKPELLATNIGEAMVTTATGLIIAIPAMMFFFYFKKGFGKTLATLGRHIGFLFDTLEFGVYPLAYKHLNEED